jgi:N-carbamoylputrescine amidase
MGVLKVALLQMTPFGADQVANQAKGEEFCRQARQMGADIALFPEMWNIGYSTYCDEPDDAASDLWRAPDRWAKDEPDRFAAMREERECWQAQAVGRDSAYVNHFRGLARELEMAIAITYLEDYTPAGARGEAENAGARHPQAPATGGAPRNTVSLIDRRGEIVLTYAKVHTCAFGMMEAALMAGHDFYVAELDTAQGPVQVGAMICYDREFPESARILMLKGAEIILIPNACEIERHRKAQLQTRATENMVGVALANYAAPQENGHSIAYDPIAFDTNGSRDNLVIEAGGGEGVYLASFDLDAIRDYRKRETWGNALRRPGYYEALTSEEVQPPFVRVNREGHRYPRAGMLYNARGERSPSSLPDRTDEAAQ